jgi:S1-C subfamily serine protease
MSRIFRLFGPAILASLVVVVGVQSLPRRSGETELREQIAHLSAEIDRLHQEQAMPSLVLRQHRDSICYIYSVYSIPAPGSTSTTQDEHRMRVSGTGFVIADGMIATNRHVVQPWYEDPEDEARINGGGKPRVEKLVAFFPSLAKSVILFDVQVSPDEDLAIAHFLPTDQTKNIHPIALAGTKPNPGDPVVVVGYPLGVSAMLAKSPRNVFSRLASTRDAIEIASDLAQHDLIRPSSTCGHVSDLVGEKVMYDAPTAQGGSGGPVFNSDGEVIAVNAAYIDGFTGGTIGITAESLKPLLKDAMQKAVPDN